jgi:hypothetical protein
MLLRYTLPLFSTILLHFSVNAFHSSPPAFIHPTETQDLNCASFMQQTVLNKEGTNRNEDMAEYRQSRVVYPDTEDWNSFKMDCESIFTRLYFQLDDLYPEEKEFPLAFARVVYKVCSSFRGFRFLVLKQKF